MTSYPTDMDLSLQPPPSNWNAHKQDAPYSSYPPTRHQANPSYVSYESNQSTLNGATSGSMRYNSRTPSPTPSEDAAMKRKGLIDWKAVSNWRFWIRREWLWYYVVLAIILVLVILISVYDKQIVRWLEPTANRIRDLPAGWLIPIAIFFIISFPPLFGHEILGILVGLVWGLWIGFAITCAGTYLGEVGNFYAFKYMCKARGEKMEKSKIQYACLARIVREGGFRVALVARYSAIPGHFTTAIFATCGMGFLVFSLAAILSLPKQFVIVYIGVVLKEEGNGTSSSKDKIVSNVVLVATILVTTVAMWYLTKKMDSVKHEVIRERRKARQAKLEANNMSYTGSVDAEADAAGTMFAAQDSEVNIPLTAGRSSHYPHPSDDSGVLAPQPVRPHGPGAAMERVPTFRTESGGGYSLTGNRYDDPASSNVAMREVGVAPHGIHQNSSAMESAESVGWDDMQRNRSADNVNLPVFRQSSPLGDSMPPESLSLSYRPSPATSPSPWDRKPEPLPLTDPFASSETLITGQRRGGIGTPSNPGSSRTSPAPHNLDDGERTAVPYQQNFSTYAPPPGPPPNFR